MRYKSFPFLCLYNVDRRKIVNTYIDFANPCKTILSYSTEPNDDLVSLWEKRRKFFADISVSQYNGRDSDSGVQILIVAIMTLSPVSLAQDNSQSRKTCRTLSILTLQTLEKDPCSGLSLTVTASAVHPSSTPPPS